MIEDTSIARAHECVVYVRVVHSVIECPLASAESESEGNFDDSSVKFAKTKSILYTLSLPKSMPFSVTFYLLR